MAENISASLGWQLADAVRAMTKRTTGPTTGTAQYVGRDSAGNALILLPGAEQATPVQGDISASAEVGSTVTYSLANGRLSITGNASDPAVGEAKATQIADVVVKPVAAAVKVTRAAADAAKSIADAAQRVASAINQHFWTSDDGIHVTEVTQEEWSDSEGESYQSGPNVLINSIGQLFRNGMNNLLSLLPAQTATDTFTGDGTTKTFMLSNTPTSLISVTVGGSDYTFFSSLSGNDVVLYNAPDSGEEVVVNYRTNETTIAIWDGQGNESSNLLASFGSVVRLGRETDRVMEIDNDEIRFLTWTGNRYQQDAKIATYSISIRDTELTRNVTETQSSYFYRIPEGSFPGYVAPTVLYTSDGSRPIYFWNGCQHLDRIMVENEVYASSGVVALRADGSSVYLDHLSTAGIWRFHLNSNSNPNVSWSSDGGTTWVSPFVNARDSRTANRVFAAPNGSNGTPSFRALVAADIPTLSGSKISSSGPTNLKLNSASVAYSSWTPKYQKWGNVVSVYGAVSPKNEVAAGGTLTIGTLPSGFSPPQHMTWLCQGSGNSTWLLQIDDTGVLTASRYRNGASVNAAMGTSVWLTFTATFIV